MQWCDCFSNVIQHLNQKVLNHIKKIRWWNCDKHALEHDSLWLIQVKLTIRKSQNYIWILFPWPKALVRHQRDPPILHRRPGMRWTALSPGRPGTIWTALSPGRPGTKWTALSPGRPGTKWTPLSPGRPGTIWTALSPGRPGTKWTPLSPGRPGPIWTALS